MKPFVTRREVLPNGTVRLTFATGATTQLAIVLAPGQETPEHVEMLAQALMRRQIRGD